MKIVWSVVTALLLAGFVQSAPAAQGEMGTGIPHFGVYSEPTGAHVKVWTIADASIALPTECTYLVLTPTTMGMDTYKVAIATLLMAKATLRKVRFYAHGPRDGGCGVDYVEPL